MNSKFNIVNLGKFRLSDLISLVFGQDRNHKMEDRLYTSSVFIAILIAVVFVGINWLIHLPRIANIICISGAVSLSVLYYQAVRYKKYHRTLFIMISLVLLSLLWLVNGGITGSGNYAFILALVIYLSITPQKHHRAILLLVVCNIILLHVLAYVKPELIQNYDSEGIQKIDLFITVVVVTIFVALIYHVLYANYEEEKYLVEVQMTEIELQHRYMKDSIQYARDIQQGYLQKKESLVQYFKEYFVFWRPKDIVSGDFYLMKTPSNDPDKVIVAVADCTGHGVPGAFLTMLGMSFINEIILQGVNLQPYEILNQLREKIKFSLSQGRQASENRDGMDMVVCIVDKKEKTLQYSGSNRSVYVARNGELVEYKGDRMPIGVHVNDDKSFENHTIALEDDDSVYLFSDGYADQYGGEDDRKYFISKFKKFLIGISDKHMLEQGKTVKQNFDDWKGNVEQTDDVLVVGFKPLAT